MPPKRPMIARSVEALSFLAPAASSSRPASVSGMCERCGGTGFEIVERDGRRYIAVAMANHHSGGKWLSDLIVAMDDLVFSPENIAHA